jgi:hypothetical protein
MNSSFLSGLLTHFLFAYFFFALLSMCKSPLVDFVIIDYFFNFVAVGDNNDGLPMMPRFYYNSFS